MSLPAQAFFSFSSARRNENTRGKAQGVTEDTHLEIEGFSITGPYYNEKQAQEASARFWVPCPVFSLVSALEPSRLRSQGFDRFRAQLFLGERVAGALCITMGRRKEARGSGQYADVSEQLARKPLNLCSSPVTPGVSIIFIVQKKSSLHSTQIM